MGARGPRSNNQLTTVTSLALRIGRPTPPEDLTAEQAEVWRVVVERMPPDYFPRETHETLAAYCRHVSRARLLSHALDRCESKHLETIDGLDHYRKMATAAERETRAVLACARSMRITQQARIDPETASRRAKSGTSTPKPWEAESFQP